MTEPTHHLRPDVVAQLDIVVQRLEAAVGLEHGDTPRLILRDALADCWHHGWLSGYDDADRRGETTPNPYHYVENG